MVFSLKHFRYFLLIIEETRRKIIERRLLLYSYTLLSCPADYPCQEEGWTEGRKQDDVVRKFEMILLAVRCDDAVN